MKRVWFRLGCTSGQTTTLALSVLLLRWWVWWRLLVGRPNLWLGSMDMTAAVLNPWKYTKSAKKSKRLWEFCWYYSYSSKPKFLYIPVITIKRGIKNTGNFLLFIRYTICQNKAWRPISEDHFSRIDTSISSFRVFPYLYTSTLG